MHRAVPRLSRRALIAAQVNGGSAGNVTTRAFAHGVISVEAKPDRMDLDLSKTSLIVVDMQNDFAAKGGLVDRLGFRPDLSDLGARIPQTAWTISLPALVRQCARPMERKAVSFARYVEHRYHL